MGSGDATMNECKVQGSFDAAQQPVSPGLLELLRHERRLAEEWRQSLNEFKAGDLRLFARGKDVSAAWISHLEKSLEEHELLLARLDPENLSI
ncbi:MAG: hypothetical protein Q8M88_03845 [Phenylobacterium sp.]|nr:hypothetical protein [Phenylobacterium sp.]